MTSRTSGWFLRIISTVPSAEWFVNDDHVHRVDADLGIQGPQASGEQRGASVAEDDDRQGSGWKVSRLFLAAQCNYLPLPTTPAELSLKGADGTPVRSS